MASGRKDPKTKKTTINLSVEHANALRHAAIDLNLGVTETIEAMISGDKKVTKQVQKSYKKAVA